MEEFSKIVLIGIITVILALVISKKSPSISVSLVIISTVIMVTMCLSLLNDLFFSIRAMVENVGIDYEIFSPVIKVCGVSIAIKISSDICKDAGYSSISTKIQFAGSIICTMLILPLFVMIIDILKELI